MTLQKNKYKKLRENYKNGWKRVRDNMGCIYDYPLDPYICDADWNCVECPNWIDESEESEPQESEDKE